jgi:ABC-type ATPase involved in cell division
MTGKVQLDGRVVDPTNINVRKRIAYIEQGVSIPATCTPWEVIRFLVKLRLDCNLTNCNIDVIVDDILNNLGLSKVADTLVGGGPLMSGGLRGGEKKRVQCGVELVTRPSLVIIDKPTSGLNSYSAQSLMDVLEQIADTGATVVVTLGGRILNDGPMGIEVERTVGSREFLKPDDYNISDWILQVAQTTTMKEFEGCGIFDNDGRKRESAMN